jgi:hypothetical protein
MINIVPAFSEAQKKLKGIDKFKAAMMKEQVAQSVKEIEVTVVDSEGSAEIVKNNVQQLKKTAKQIIEIRKEHTKVLDIQKKRYMELEKYVLAPLNDVIDMANKKVSQFAMEQRKKAAEEEKRLRAKQMEKGQFIDAAEFMVDKIIERYNAAIHNKDMDTLNAVHREYFAKEKGKLLNLIKEFGREETVKVIWKYLVEAGKKVRLYILDMASKEDAKEYLQQTKKTIAARFELSLSDVGEQEEEKIQEAKKTAKASSKGTYHVIDYTVEDFNKLPGAFKKLVVNDDAIKMFIKENKDKIANNDASIEGVSFHVETKIRG